MCIRDSSKRYPWVNYDDDLDKTVYAALYAAIGDTMSDGAADGMFNCKKLAERFPLVCGANFEALKMCIRDRPWAGWTS